MSYYTTTMKAAWAEAKEKECTQCGKKDCVTYKTGVEKRGKVDYWWESRWCKDCKNKLPHTA
jgi:hypothetical protein